MGKIKKLSVMAVLTAASLVVYVIEAQVPAPVALPGIKLGLANIFTLFTLAVLGRREAGMVMLVRVVLGSLICGQLMAMIYSLAGGLLSWGLCCALLPAFRGDRLWVLSVFSAMAHNIGQLLAAALVTGTVSVMVFLPALLLSGIVCGAFTGLCAQLLIGRIPGEFFS